MKKCLVLFFVLAMAFLAGCANGSQVLNKPVTNQNTNANIAVDTEIEATETSGEIDNPNLKLPADINSGQIQKYFQIRDVYYALVMQSSMNILLGTPTGFQPQFVGVLRANKEDTAWTKFIEIKDTNATDKNNPYYLWLENGQLWLSVVDQNGAGSGEGIMKVYLIMTNKTELTGCYYYSGTDPVENYLSNTKKTNLYDRQPIESCNNVQINVIDQI